MTGATGQTGTPDEIGWPAALVDYRRGLERALPADLTEELLDGLDQTYRHHLGRTGDAGTAAASALREFGDLRRVVRCCVRSSRPWRAARDMLVAGPVVGATWAALLLSDARRSLVPATAAVSLGALVTSAAALLAAALVNGRYRRTRRLALLACGLILVIDVLAVGGATALVPPSALLAVAATASLCRALLTLRAIRQALHPA